MAKYRKKPIIIEAEQWFRDKEIDEVKLCKQWIDDYIPQKTTECYPVYTYWGEIKTLEGTMKVKEGDWIITGIKGEKYSCDNDIFQKTYELVEE